MERKNYTVAVDLGSSSVVVAVGSKGAEGTLDVACVAFAARDLHAQSKSKTESQRIEEQRRVIAELEREKYPLYRREMENDRNISALRRMRIKRQWWRLEGSREFDARVDALREKKAGLRRTYRYRAGVIREEIERIAGLQEAERRKQKKLEKSYEDFMKLLTFVETVEDDDFWRSEVVQITAKTTPSGALEVELTPRSGRFAVLFGRLEDVERKFDKLLRFYRSGLSSIGWSEYRTIDIRYNDQVVCKK